MVVLMVVGVVGVSIVVGVVGVVGVVSFLVVSPWVLPPEQHAVNSYS
jgi:hypothetical protein